MLLAVEFFDELVFGALAAAWPQVRPDLELSYVQVGILLALPQVFGSLLELPIFLLGEGERRRLLVRSGGVALVAALVLIATSSAFAALLCALMLASPASGAFVSLSQASLMDLEPGRREPNMARWALAGSLGLVAGPLALAAFGALGLGWRATFGAFAVLGVPLVAAAWRAPAPSVSSPPAGVEGEAALGAPPADASGPDRAPLSARSGPDGAHPTTASAFEEVPPPAAAGLDAVSPPLRRTLLCAARDGVRALRRREVLRWLTLLQLSDLMLDVFHGFLALYLVDATGASAGEAAFAIVVWTGVGVVGDALMIPVLERVDGARYLRISAAATLVVFPGFLLTDGWTARLALLGALGLLNSGWYAVLQGRLYRELPGRSGTALALGNVFGLAGGLLPLAVGLAAQRLGLSAALWLLLAGPLALALGAAQRGAEAGRAGERPDPAGDEPGSDAARRASSSSASRRSTPTSASDW